MNKILQSKDTGYQNGEIKTLLCVACRRLTSASRTYRQKVKGFQCMGAKESRVPTFALGKIGLKTKNYVRCKGGGRQSNRRLNNFKYIHTEHRRITQLQGTYVSYSTMERSSTQKINKETLDLNNPLDQMDLDISEHPIQQQQSTHSSQVHKGQHPGQITGQATKEILLSLR